MKRLLSVILALAVMASTATVAFAEGGEKAEKGFYSGIAEFDNPEVFAGESVYLDVDYFYGKWKEKEDVWDDDKKDYVRKNVTYDNEDYPIGSLDSEYHTVSASWTSGGQYIQNVYFEDGDAYVTIEIKGGISSTVEKEIRGTIKIIEKGVPNHPTVTYECKIKGGALILQGVDEKAQVVEVGYNHEFSLPDDYQERDVRFRTDDGETYGTFVGEFYSENTSKEIAEFRVRVNGQSPLFLGFSESASQTVKNSYPNAKLRFINWTAKPTFDREGKLSIYMDPSEYIYGVNSNGTLYRLGGTYDTSAKAYVITTKTLGSYVISDTQLVATSGSGSSGSSAAASSPSSASASGAAPSAAAPSSSAPAAQEPSGSSEDEPSSEPEEIASVESSSSSSSSGASQPAIADVDEEKDFPLVPVLLGALGIVILVCAVVVVGNRNKGSHSRRRRYDDDWDD